jgi:hypothetical protein
MIIINNSIADDRDSTPQDGNYFKSHIDRIVLIFDLIRKVQQPE